MWSEDTWPRGTPQATTETSKSIDEWRDTLGVVAGVDDVPFAWHRQPPAQWLDCPTRAKCREQHGLTGTADDKQARSVPGIPAQRYASVGTVCSGTASTANQISVLQLRLVGEFMGIASGSPPQDGPEAVVLRAGKVYRSDHELTLSLPQLCPAREN